MIVGADSKRHRICHPCLKVHLASGRSREHAVSFFAKDPVFTITAEHRTSVLL